MATGYLYECKLCGFSKTYKSKHVRHVCAKQHETSKKHLQLLDLQKATQDSKQEPPQQPPQQPPQEPPQEKPVPKPTPKQIPIVNSPRNEEQPKLNRLKRMLKNMLELSITMFDVVKEMNPTHPAIIKKTPNFLYLVDEYKDIMGVNIDINSKLQEIEELKRKRKEEEERRRQELEKARKALEDAQRKYEEAQQPLNEIVETTTINAQQDDIQVEYNELDKRYKHYLHILKQKMELDIDYSDYDRVSDEIKEQGRTLDNQQDIALNKIKSQLNLLRQEDEQNWLEKSKSILINIQRNIPYVEISDQNTAYGILMKSVGVV